MSYRDKKNQKRNYQKKKRYIMSNFCINKQLIKNNKIMIFTNNYVFSLTFSINLCTYNNHSTKNNNKSFCYC